MSLLANSNAIESGGYNIDRSLRFRASASAYLNRTPASAGNRKTWTWSGWVKRGELQNTWFLGADDGTLYSQIQFSDNYLRFGHVPNTGGTVYGWRTQAVFRDPSAWYHIVFAIDTTQATAANRIRIYVNGIEQTSLVDATGYGAIPQNTDTFINAALPHMVGRFIRGANNQMDGYLAEVNFIVGQALTPSSFGQTDAVTGVWTPKKYTGTYGTNGFYLDFKDNTSATTLAYDKSGNGNNWTPNNISTTSGASYDSMTDVPTLTSATAANYCVLNPNDVFLFTAKNGNLTGTINGGYNGSIRGSMAVSSGKWYWEYQITVQPGAAGQAPMVGIVAADSNINQSASAVPNHYGYYGYNGYKLASGVYTTYGATFALGDVMGIALDLDSGTITYYKNNVSQGVAFSGLSGYFCPYVFDQSTGGETSCNFGQRPFSYTPPTGFKALNTFNLPDPTIKKPNQYMDATTYSGNSGTQTVTNSGGMQPDLVWVKTRNAAEDHGLFDSVRGANKWIGSNSTAAESTIANSLSFATNGFTLSSANWNESGKNIVGWQWKKGATPGFDIVTYTGNGASTQTVNHSLGVAPKMIIGKNRSRAADWPVYHTSLSANNNLFLDLTNAQVASPSYGWIGAPSSTTITLNMGTTNGFQSNQLNDTFVAYLFAEIAGFSKFGSYTGNGSADGPFVYCGFRPKYVMIKSASGVADWYIFDSARETYNPEQQALEANLSNAEDTWINHADDFLSNGFKVRNNWANQNTNGNQYIFACFAENPFKYSLAR